MGEIAYPSQRTFFKTNNGSGFTEVDQVTSSGDPAFQKNTDAITLYPALPSSGALKQGAIYSSDGGMVIIEKDCDKVEILSAEAKAEVLTIYRKNNEGQWVIGEKVIQGDRRIFNKITYICLKEHLTFKGGEPDKAKEYWKVSKEDAIIEPIKR